MNTQPIHSATSYSPRQWLILLFGIGCYVLVNGIIFYVIGFVGNFGVPKAIDDGSVQAPLSSIGIDVALLLLFGIQHSIMARRSFKRRLAQWIPASLERSVFVLTSVLMLMLLIWQWRPLPELVWSAQNPLIRALAYGLFGLGWTIMLLATYLIDHYELFGLRQVFLHLQGFRLLSPTFKIPLLYQHVRHPMMLGFLIGFWSTPDMSLGHLIFSLGMTVYIMIGVSYEEKDLLRQFGPQYQQYRCLVPRLIPSSWSYQRKKTLLKLVRSDKGLPGSIR